MMGESFKFSREGRFDLFGELNGILKSMQLVGVVTIEGFLMLFLGGEENNGGFWLFEGDLM